MIRILEEDILSRDKIKMADMKPLQIASLVICNEEEYVMRTASINFFEVMNLSQPKARNCYSLEDSKDLEVELLNPNETIVIGISNDSPSMKKPMVDKWRTF